VREQPAADPPCAPVWTAAIGSATPDEAYAVAVAAYAHSRLDDAAAALRRARDSFRPDVAASAAGPNLGVVLGDLGRPQEELAAYQQLIDAPLGRRAAGGGSYCFCADDRNSVLARSMQSRPQPRQYDRRPARPWRVPAAEPGR
jgi:hypothetical protein